MTDDELHRARLGDNLLNLLEIDQERAVTAHNHRVGLELILHLPQRDAQHLVARRAIDQMADLDIVANGLNLCCRVD